MLRHRKFENSDGLLIPHIQYDPNWTRIQNRKRTDLETNWKHLKVKEEPVYSNMQIDTYGSFQPEEHHVYQAVWKENFFSNILSLGDLRGTRYTCLECNEIFATKLSILTHSKIHRKYFCVACLLYFDYQYEMTAHLTSFHASLVELIGGNLPSPNSIKTSNSFVSTEQIVVNETKIKTEFVKVEKVLTRPKVRATRKLFRIKSSLRRRCKIEPTDKMVGNTTKTFTSRFGRCVTLKIPYR